MEYFISRGAKEEGPFTLHQLRTMWQTGSITGDTAYWREGLAEWGQLRNIVEILDDPASRKLSPLAQVSNALFVPDPSRPPRSGAIYCLLAFFFGWLGLHNFYAGYTAIAFIQLGLSLLLCWTLVVPILVACWAMLEIFFVKKDARGVPFDT